VKTHHVEARIAPAEPASAPVSLRLREEAPGRATAGATHNGPRLLDDNVTRGGRGIHRHVNGGAPQGRISGTLWQPQGRLWLLDLDQPAA